MLRSFPFCSLSSMPFIQNSDISFVVSFSLPLLHVMAPSFSCERNNSQNIYVHYARLPISDNISSHKTARTQTNFTIWTMKAKWQILSTTKPNIDLINRFKERFFPQMTTKKMKRIGNSSTPNLFHTPNTIVYIINSNSFKSVGCWLM